MFLLLFALVAGLNILLGLKLWPYVLSGHLQDPDSYMRLVRLGQSVQAGHLGITVAGDQSGAGVMVEWSRLYDAALWLLAAPFAPLVGWHQALFCAGVASGPIGVGLLGMTLAWAVEPLALRRHVWTAAMAAALLPGLMSVAQPGVVHYHVALLTLIALTVGGVVRAWRGNVLGAAVAGLGGGFAMWMTPETMPFVLAAYVPLLVRLLDTDNTKIIAIVAAAQFDIIAMASIVDPVKGNFWAPETDRMSVVYFFLALGLLMVAMLLMRLAPRLGRARGRAGWIAFALVMGIWVKAFPGVVEGPFGLLPPAEAHAFFNVISEQMPLTWQQDILFLAPAALAVLYALWRAWSSVKPRTALGFLDTQDFLVNVGGHRARLLWIYAALVGVASLVLGARFMLFTEFPAGFAAGLLPVALSDVDRRCADSPRRALWGRMAVLALVLVAPDAATLNSAAPATTAAATQFPTCALDTAVPLLAPAAGQVVEAPPEDTPELLYRTRVETVGSLYHHGIDGYMRDRALWRAAPDNAKAAITDAHAAWVLFCPTPGRYALVADLPADTTLWDALEAGHPPAWLSPAGTSAGGWQLYKITL